MKKAIYYLVIFLFLSSLCFNMLFSFTELTFTIFNFLLLLLIFLTAYSTSLAFDEYNNHYMINVFLIIFIFPLLYITLFTHLYQVKGLTAPSENYVVTIYDYFYFSIVTWTTLGYGDFQPTNDIKIYASIQAFIGYLFNGLIIAMVFKVFDKIVYLKYEDNQ